MSTHNNVYGILELLAMYHKKHTSLVSGSGNRVKPHKKNKLPNHKPALLEQDFFYDYISEDLYHFVYANIWAETFRADQDLQ